MLPLCHICPFRLKLINDINNKRYPQADFVDIERVLLSSNNRKWGYRSSDQKWRCSTTPDPAKLRPKQNSSRWLRKILPKNVTKKNRMWRIARRSRRSWKACPILMWGRASRCWRYDEDSTDDDDADDGSSSRFSYFISWKIEIHERDYFKCPNQMSSNEADWSLCWN